MGKQPKTTPVELRKNFYNKWPCGIKLGNGQKIRYVPSLVLETKTIWENIVFTVKN